MRLGIRWAAATMTLAMFLGSTSATAALVDVGTASSETAEVSAAKQAKIDKKAKKSRKAEKRAARKARKKAAKRAAKRARKEAKESAKPPIATPAPRIETSPVEVVQQPIFEVKPLPVVEIKPPVKIEPKPTPIEVVVVKPPVKVEPKPDPKPETRPRPETKLPTLECAKPAKRKGLRPRWQPEKSVKFAFFKGRDERRLVLKLRDDACANAKKGRLVTSSDRDLVAVAKTIAEAAPNAHVTRRFQASDKALEAARQEGEKNIGQRLADMRQYYWILLDKADHMKPLLSALVRLDSVENVYSPSLPVAPPGDIVAPVTPDFSANQGYRNAAPGGVDIDFAVNVVGEGKGGTGGAVTIADIEYAWNTSHEDLSARGANMLYTLGAAGSGFSPFGNDHGTAVAGVIVADSDSPGIRGIAPAAGFWAVPSLADATSAVDNAQAILDVAVVDPTRRLGARGVLLLEVQASGPNAGANQFGLVPIEYDQAEFDAIKQATAMGVVVIEAAANGGQDLDLRGGNTGDPTYNRFDPRVRHSGAILVGSASSTAPHTPRATSNVGVRVDTYSWGQNIFTLGYGSLRNDGFPAGDFDPNQRYVTNFGGTSGASAIVAGVAALLESVHFVNHHSLSAVRNMDAAAMRLLLRTTGTQSNNPAADRIGRQPDMAEQLPLLSMGPNLGSVFTGDVGDAAGSAVAPIDDVDGDGIDDIIVGSPGAGTVTVYSGGSGDVIVSFSGNVGERFGAAVSAVEDIDGDGLQDVIVGVPGAFPGRVTIHSTGSGQTERVYFGAQNGDEFGAAVASQGDVDGDGMPEIVVGAPKFDLFGTDGGRVFNISTGTDEIRWTKDGVSGANYGSVIVTGDVAFDDGQLDILVGSPNDPGFANNAAGRVFLYQASGDTWQIYTGAEASAQFGSSIALVGDRDGDGRSDFAIGSPGEGNGRGSVAIYSGHSGGLLQFAVGQTIGARFGSAVAGPGDIDNDGVVDVLVGAPFEGGSDGAVFAIGLGSGTTSVRATYSGESTGDRFGSTLAVVGDVNGDGQGELVSGAPGSTRGGSGSGAAYLFVLPTFGFDF